MEVTENVHGVNVVFWKTHVGHVNDLKHLTLSKEDRARLEGNRENFFKKFVPPN